MARRQRAIDPQLISSRAGAFEAPALVHPRALRRHNLSGDKIMGKYLVGWLLGVPVFVLVILYFFFH